MMHPNRPLERPTEATLWVKGGIGPLEPSKPQEPPLVRGHMMIEWAALFGAVVSAFALTIIFFISWGVF
jgi:hypothetical protein